jgi:two-component system, cell cycle response regulator DivK
MADPALKPTPVAAVSSFAMKGDEEKAREAGCDHYVTKPYSPMQLLRLVRGFLGDARTLPAFPPVTYASDFYRLWIA